MNRRARLPQQQQQQQQLQLQQQQQRMQAQMSQMQQNSQNQQQQQQTNQQLGGQRGATMFQQSAQNPRPGSSQAVMPPQPQAPVPASAPATKRENKQNQTPRPETQNPSPAVTSKGIKRSNSDDVVEVPNPNAQSRQMHGNGQQQQPQMRNLPTAEQLNAMSPEKRKQVEQMIRMSQIAQRYKQIQNEENENFQRQMHAEIPVTPEHRNSMAKACMGLVPGVKQVSNILDKWFAQTVDEDRLRKFLRLVSSSVKLESEIYTDGIVV